MNVEVGANYMSSGGAPVSIQLPPEGLRPFEAKQVDLSDELNSAGLVAFNGSINLAGVFTGKADDLIVATGSVDQTGTYVFEVAPQAVSKTNRKIGSYWNAANGNDTMFSLWNPTANAQDIAMTFYYGDGSGAYNLPVHLEAQASTMVDINMLKMEQTPDSKGNAFRDDVAEGSVSFASAKPATWMTLVAAGGTFNVQTATCGNVCVECCGYDYGESLYISPNGEGLSIGHQLTYTVYGSDCTGGTVVVPVDSWTTYDTTVATVGGSGVATGVGPGDTTIEASTSAYVGPPQQMCSGEGQPECVNSDGSSTLVDADVPVPAPASLYVVSVQMSGSCENGYPYGIYIAIEYQVRDQNNAPVMLSGMEPQEEVTNAVYNGQPQGNPTPNWTDLVAGEVSNSQGQFADAPFGTCSPIAFTYTDTQSISVLLNGTRYVLRTNNLTTQSSSAGHGSVTNGSDISASQ